MNPDFFQKQMLRLVETFGKAHYGTERVGLLWQEVSHFEDFWFGKVINKFISENRHAPLLPEFREEISKERERIWNEQKRQNAQDAKKFWDEGPFTDAEARMFFKTIRDRINGLCSDEHWDSFLRVINGGKVS